MELVAKAGSLLQASLLLCETQHIGRESWAGFLPPLVKQAHDDPSQGGSSYACLWRRHKPCQGRGTPSCVSGTRDGELARRLAWQLQRAALASFPPSISLSSKISQLLQRLPLRQQLLQGLQNNHSCRNLPGGVGGGQTDPRGEGGS